MTPLFLVVAPGLEAVAAQEAARLGKVKVVPGGVELDGDPLLANLTLGIPSKVLLRVGTVQAENFERLRKGIAALPWKQLVPAAPTVTVKASASRCRLYHTGGIAERVVAGITDAFPPVRGLRMDSAPSPGAFAPAIGSGGPELTVMVRGERDVFTVSVDTSGELLYKRGFRTDAGPASLRETLAVGLLALAAWDPAREALCDPMCGAGTIVLEAAAIASGLAPGRARSFACEAWPRATPRPQLPAAHPAARPILASDRDPRAITWTTANAARAGVTLSATRADADKLELPPGPGLIIANPPYGKRLGPGTAHLDAYRALGALHRRSPGWRLAALVARNDPRARGHLGSGKSHLVDNGGLRLELVVVAT